MKNNPIIRWAMALFAIIALGTVAPFLNAHPDAGVGLCFLPMLCIRPRLRDKEEGDGGGGGGGMSDAEFKTGVLGSVKQIQTAQEKLLTNVNNLDKETKKTLEDLTKIKNDFQGHNDEFKRLDQTLKKLQLQLTMEARMAQGGNTLSLGQRVVQDKESCKQVFAAIARSIGRNDIAMKALGEDSSPGSTMINDALSADIYHSLLSYGAWATLGVRPVGTVNTKLPVKTARPVANFITTEGGTISDDTTKAGTSLTMNMEVVGVLLNVSLQLIQDGEYDVVADVLDDFIEAVNYRCDFGAFQGNGTTDATNGGFTGLFAFGTAATATSTRTTIAATKYDDWLKCLTTVDASVLSRPAKWWIHPSLMAAAIAVTDSNGRPIFQTALEAPQAGGILNLFGYPVVPVGAAPSTNAASAKVAVFGDPRAFAVGMRKAFTFEESDHARWNTFERSFRGVSRFGAKGLKASALAIMTLPAS